MLKTYNGFFLYQVVKLKNPGNLEKGIVYKIVEINEKRVQIIPLNIPFGNLTPIETVNINEITNI